MQSSRLWVTGPYQVQLQLFDLPDVPPFGQVLIEIERTLMSAGTELAIVTGTHIGFTTGAAWPRYPMALGYTAYGRVLRVGDGVSDLGLGERVVAAAPHATYALVSAQDVLRVPPGCSPEGALLAHLASIPLNGVRLASPRLGEGMVVFGQGLIGALAARFGWLAGCRPVIGVDPIAERRELAQRAGLVAVDPRSSDVAAVCRELARGRPPEIVIEATGAPSVIPDALRVVANLGRVVLLGSPRGRVEIDPYTDVHRKGVSLIGAHANVAPAVATLYNPFTAMRNRELALGLVADGSLKIDGLISHRIRPEEASDTYRALAERAAGYLGVVIDWTR